MKLRSLCRFCWFFHQRSFSVAESHSGSHIVFSCCASLASSGDNFSVLPLCFDDLDSFEEYWCLIGCSPVWVCLMFFSWWDQDSGFWGERPPRYPPSSNSLMSLSPHSFPLSQPLAPIDLFFLCLSFAFFRMSYKLNHIAYSFSFFSV